MRLTAILGAILLLAGCTDSDWNNTLSNLGMIPEPAVAPAVALAQTQRPAPAAPSYSFCHAVAVQDALQNEFDAATRQRMAADSFRQCVALVGDANQK